MTHTGLAHTSNHMRVLLQRKSMRKQKPWTGSDWLCFSFCGSKKTQIMRFSDTAFIGECISCVKFVTILNQNWSPFLFKPCFPLLVLFKKKKKKWRHGCSFPCLCNLPQMFFWCLSLVFNRTLTDTYRLSLQSIQLTGHREARRRSTSGKKKTAFYIWFVFWPLLYWHQKV